jgi:cytochrome c biogenesis protein CcmG/thiol:disulfide interchange protein DsbE
MRILNRIWDLLAVVIVLAIGWKLFLAPRALSIAKAYPAPHATYALLDGGSFDVTQARGRVLFLDFYASWCEPCRRELPAVEAYARAHPQVDVVPVDVGEPRPVVAAFAGELHLRGVAMDPQALSRGFFALDGFPTIVTIDPQGRVRATWQGYNPAIESAMANAQRTLAAAAPIARRSAAAASPRTLRRLP